MYMSDLQTMKARLLRVSWGKLVIFLIVLLALLQVLHMTLLSRLETRDEEAKRSQMVKVIEDGVQKLFLAMTSAVASSRIVDSSGIYKIVTDITGSSKDSDPRDKLDITLVTQCSVNHMHFLTDLTTRWDGPVSVAVFAPETHVSTAIVTVLKLQQCLPSLQHRLQVHLVFPLTQQNPEVSLASMLHELEQIQCGNLKDYIHRKVGLQQQNYILGQLKFPNNLLRNVGVNSARTSFVLVIDIDMVPSSNLHGEFIDFAQRHSLLSKENDRIEPQTVFIIPAFEIQNQVPLPSAKEDLLKLWDQRTVRPFYQELCWKCQKLTDYSSWRNLSHSSMLDFGYEVEWKDPWEPFYIGPATLPRYDERFKQYGFNRISQVCELHVAGYRFAVLNRAFLVHRGFKTEQGFHQGKDSEQEVNRQLFRQFKEELKTKYPDSARRCY